MATESQAAAQTGPSGASIKFALSFQRQSSVVAVALTARAVPLVEYAGRFTYCQGALMPGFSAPIRVNEETHFLAEKKVVVPIVLQGRVRGVQVGGSDTTTRTAIDCFLDFLVYIAGKGALHVTVLEFGDMEPADVQALFWERVAPKPAAPADKPPGAPVGQATPTDRDPTLTV